ncbi:MAG: NlpC/P60 family protein [Pseudomonadota bacterium]
MDDRYLKLTGSLASDSRLVTDADGEREIWHVTAPVCTVLSEPDDKASATTQLIFGEDFSIIGEEGEWVIGQAPRDHYIGYVRRSHLRSGASEATHHVIYHGTFIYSTADMKSRPVMKVPMSARLQVVGEEEVRRTEYYKVPNGYVIKNHLRPLDHYFEDFVSVGETAIGMSYLWGGRTPFGLDCSGLVQLCLQMAGIAVLRDSDMQEATIGDELPLDPGLGQLQRGDLIFWPGHVGIMRDSRTLLHANGHTMTVASEPLVDAVERIAYLYGPPRSIRRPFALSSHH